MKENLKSLAHLLFEGHGVKARWIALFILLVTVVFVLLAFDHLTSWSYYRELNQQTGILERLNILANDGIQDDTLLVDPYEEIVSQISSHPAKPTVDRLFPGGTQNHFTKFFTASLLGFLLLLASIFTPQKSKGKAILGSVMVILVFGAIGALIPTILHPAVNYIILPVVQLIALLLLFRAIFRQTIQRAKMTACRANMRTISSQVSFFFAQHKKFPRTTEAALQEISIVGQIVCPECRQKYIISFNDSEYTIRCPNEPSHGSVENGRVTWDK